MKIPALIPPSRRNGFTLIEVMVVVVIVAILAAIAIPSYQQFIRKGNRAAAQAFLMDVAQRQQQYLMDTRSYAPDIPTLNMGGVPSVVSPYYTVTIALGVGAPPSFVITATPVVGSVQASDPTLTLDNTGAKTPTTLW